MRRGARRRRPAHGTAAAGSGHGPRPRAPAARGHGATATGGQCAGVHSHRSGRRVGGGPAYGSSPAARDRSSARTAARSARGRRPGGRALRSRPSSSIDSYSGGETVRPLIATRTGPNAWRGLSPRPSTSAALSASSIAGVDHSGSSRSAVVAASRMSASLGAQLLGGRRLVDLDVVDEQEAEQADGVGQHDHPLLGQRRDRVEDAPLLRGRRIADQAGRARGTGRRGR